MNIGTQTNAITLESTNRPKKVEVKTPATIEAPAPAVATAA